VRSSRFDAKALALGAAAVLALAAAAMGATPVVLSLVTIVALWRPLSSRFGPVAGLAAALLSWMTLCLALVAVAPALPLAMPAEVGVGLAATACAAPALGVAQAAARRVPTARGDLLASCSGLLVWCGSLVASLMAPRGSGFSWAAYIDSSLDVFEMRKIAAYGGLNSLASFNPRPFEHALSSAALPWGLTLDSSAQTFRAEVLAHAYTWTLLVGATCILAGLVVTELSRARGASVAASRTAGAVVSLLMLSTPVSGIIFYRGQINAHIVWLVLFCCAVLAYSWWRSPATSLALVIAATTILMLAWTPFAAVPACFVVWGAVRHRQPAGGRSTAARLSIVLAVALFAWALVSFSALDLLKSALPSSSTNESRVGISTVLANPAWLPLTLVVLAAVLMLSLTLRHLDGRAAEIGLTFGAGITIGTAYLALAGGLSAVPTSYYPAKFLHLATVALVPLAVGLAMNRAIRGTVRVRAMVAAGAIAIAALALVAPLSDQIDRWGSVPVDLATGHWFGTRAQMIDKVFGYSSNDTARLAWRADGDFDFYVNWMLSIAEPAPPGQFSTPYRSELRNHGFDMSADRACAVAHASERPLELISRDAGLEPELELLCPSEQIEVVLD
jgi:hypothetical protein